MEKLKFYSMRGKCNTWISDFLTDRIQAVVVNREHSYEAHVTSGVPQGSVLGPSLFRFYINDITEELDSTVRLFSEDTIVYLAVRNSDDVDSLQNDLHKLGRWEKKWLMEFHPDKCQVLTITRKWQPVTYNYILNGHQLEHVSDAKYLGITFTNDMRWSQHIDNITAKANKTLHFLQRNVQIKLPQAEDNGIPNTYLLDPRWNMPPQYGTHTPRATSTRSKWWKKSCKVCPTSIPQQIECEWDAATLELAAARSPKTTSETCHAVQDSSWHGSSQQSPIPPTSCQNIKARTLITPAT